MKAHTIGNIFHFVANKGEIIRAAEAPFFFDLAIIGRRCMIFIGENIIDIEFRCWNFVTRRRKPVRTLPAEARAEDRALGLQQRIERASAAASTGGQLLDRPVDQVVAVIALDRALVAILPAHVMQAEAANVEGPEIALGLAMDDPLRDSPAGTARGGDARGEAAGDEEVVQFRRLAEDRFAVGRDRDRAVDQRTDAELLQDRQALGRRGRNLLEAIEVRRQQLAAELERRVEAATRDIAMMREQRERLLNAIVDGQRLMDEDVAKLEGLRQEMIVADEMAVTIKLSSEKQEDVIRDARRTVDALRALAAEVDVQRATAESDLTHLAQQALDNVNASLDEIRDEVAQMEAAGQVQPDVRAIRAAEAVDPDELDEDGVSTTPEESDVTQPVEGVQPPAMTAEEAIAELREKIDRMGPVNMMAIEQSKELEERHSFLSTQRQDLVDSIAQTNEAISKIDETTHARFKEAFAAINENFQQMFSTLFGGGKAGIVLLDENDPLESGIDIVAQPPGKRLQSVMLLSGGEKALTAIALMFGMFKYRPSPFCLLDEIDAPLDDANIGRFVQMLQSMMDKTQFIVITHSRRTMEWADSLYGVTMDVDGEPDVCFFKKIIILLHIVDPKRSVAIAFLIVVSVFPQDADANHVLLQVEGTSHV